MSQIQGPSCDLGIYRNSVSTLPDARQEMIRIFATMAREARQSYRDYYGEDIMTGRRGPESFPPVPASYTQARESGQERTV